MNSDKGTWLPYNLHLNMLSEKCSLSDVYLVSLVYSFDKGNKVFYASNKYISKLLGVTERRVRQIVTNLVESGWLQRSMKTCNRGSERHLTITNKTREAIFNPPREEDNYPLEGVVFSSNNKNNNKENNRDTATSKQGFVSDEPIRKIICNDLKVSYPFTDEVDINHAVFSYYEAAYRWSLLRDNVIIERNPNSSIISSLLFSDLLNSYSIRDFVYILDYRWQKRNIHFREVPVNLSWLIVADCDDERMKDYILDCELDIPERTLKSINEMLECYG
ncbi:helix-turn-helix domain-containing protein [Photobacterium leiognathi]|uniref:helix-turn-helix domain-containing protein n=1 Tax=Photobacterium leiognathi TaxID=553611 RepID=UPI0029826285|nr:helix-turn-helix domain-containing protein [Photobacterium leiognathi]